MKSGITLFAIVVLLAPFAAWAAYKPIRVLAPELVGVNCISDQICLEKGSPTSNAKELYEMALYFVESTVGEINKKPRVTFCITEYCYEAFGFRAPAKATTVGLSGIVVSPRGWNIFYLRHEMIHHLQAERTGVIGLLFSPEWFNEGMAYSFSRQPRDEYKEPWRTYTFQFDKWYEKIGAERLWEEASRL